MKLQLFRLKCGTCGNWFESPEIGELAYGEFLLRSPSGEIRYLNANDDAVFIEVDNLIGRDERVITLDHFQRADILDKVFGRACDRDSHGNEFIVSERPPCTQCGRHNVLEWQAVDPISYIEVGVEPVTHVEWLGLNAIDKERRIRESLTVVLNKKSNQP